MSSRSNSLHTHAGDCPLQQLNAIQWRAASNKQHLANLSPLLTTNDPLYPESINHILARSGSHDSRTDLRQLDHIVRHLQSILDIAKETRADILTSASQFDILLHPVRSLPDDILLLIFEWCTFSHKFLAYDCASLNNEYPPWKLSHVCRRWRNLVLASPYLWSVVDIPTPLVEGIPDEDIIASRLDLQLKRSGNALLDITIGTDDYLPASYLLHGTEEILSLLRPTTNRWRSLLIYDDGLGNDKVFLGCNFPALKCLKIHDDTEYGVDAVGHEGIFTVFRHTPSLVHLDVGSAKVDINWDNITSYETYAKSLAAHSLLPSLQELTLLEPFTRNYEQPTELPPLSLPNLHTLILHFHLDVKLIDYLSMPSLETLKLILSFSSSEPIHYPDLRRCSEHLRNLNFVLRGNPTDIQPLLAFLAEAQHVTSLSLQIEDGALLNTQALRMNGTNDLFPRLESLTLVLSILDDEAYAEVRAVIESRIPRIYELKLIGRKKDWLWEVTFAELRRLGVKVSYVDTKEF